MYSLEHDDSGFVLSILCGSLAMYEVKIKLTEEEIDTYEKQGKKFLDLLANEISHSPNRFRERWIPG